jgi:hypothetical protein
MRSQSEDAPQSTSNPNLNEQGSSTSTFSNFHQRSASIPLTFFPDSDQDDLGGTGHFHTRRDTAPELDMIGLTTMADFDLGDVMGFGEDAEMERAMNRDLARVGELDMGSSPDTPAKRPRSPYIKWSKEEDDLLAQVRFAFSFVFGKDR